MISSTKRRRLPVAPFTRPPRREAVRSPCRCRSRGSGSEAGIRGVVAMESVQETGRVDRLRQGRWSPRALSSRLTSASSRPPRPRGPRQLERPGRPEPHVPSPGHGSGVHAAEGARPARTRGNHGHRDFRGVEPGGTTIPVFEDGATKRVYLGGIVEVGAADPTPITTDGNLYAIRLGPGRTRFGAALKNALRDGPVMRRVFQCLASAAARRTSARRARRSRRGRWRAGTASRCR